MFQFFIRLFFRKKKQINVFDDKFGFILKHKIDSEQNYNKVKSHFFQYHQASE